MDALLDESDINKLRWRCRRGLLENDLFIERFFSAHQHTMTQGQANGLLALMDLGDNDLLDLLLRRKELQALPDLPDSPEARQVLALLRPQTHQAIRQTPTERHRDDPL